jgi:hypothetical protein
MCQPTKKNILKGTYEQNGIVHIYRCNEVKLNVQEQTALTTLSAVASCAKVRGD